MKKEYVYFYNYCKLWLYYQLNEQFSFAIHLLRKKWQFKKEKLPPKNQWKKLEDFESQALKKTTKSLDGLSLSIRIGNRELMNAIYTTELSKLQKENLLGNLLAQDVENFPTYAFYFDIFNLQKEFSLGPEWETSLKLFLITGLISPPSDKTDENSGVETLVRYSLSAMDVEKETGVVLHKNSITTSLRRDKEKSYIPYKYLAEEKWDLEFGYDDALNTDDESYDSVFQMAVNKKSSSIKQSVSRARKSKYYAELNPPRIRYLVKVFFPSYQPGV